MNLAGVDLNLLVVFEALFEERSVTRAARRVGRTQSATSHALGRLRALAGDPLFVRAGARIEPTARARALAGPIGEALARVREALGPPPGFDPARAEGLVRIGAVDLAQVLLVPRLSAALAREAPGVRLAVAPFPARPARALAEGDLDLAIGRAGVSPELRERPLAELPFACVVRRDHPCVAGGLDLAGYAALPHALVSPRGVPRGAVDEALAAHGLARRVVLTTSNVLAAALVVARSELVLTIGADVAAAAAELLPLAVLAPPVAIPPYRLALAWHPRRDADPLHGWVRDRVAALA